MSLLILHAIQLTDSLPDHRRTQNFSFMYNRDELIRNLDFSRFFLSA